MPRIVRVKVHTPMSVRRAAVVLGSELRIQLARHYLRHPGPQKDAVEALGVTKAVVSQNTVALLEAGVLTVTPTADGRSNSYSVDRDELRTLLGALSDFLDTEDEDED